MSSSRHDLCFGPFRLDVGEERLWQGDTTIPLTPKAFALLEFMARRPDKLVRKNELLDALWADVIVGDAVLKVTVRELRKALGDDARAPRFIATVHRRGYRFVSEVEERAAAPAGGDAEREPAGEAREGAEPEPGRERGQLLPLVGRDDARAQLDGALRDAREGRARMLFVTGDVGLGKTALVDDFVRAAEESGEELTIGRGFCVEHYGAGEPYLPILQALSGVCRDGRDAAMLAILAKHAPTWLLQLPALLEHVARDELRRDTLGATGERMLREMVDLLEAASAARPLSLVLEDLHWADLPTLELLSLVARKCRSARLLVVGTYRKSEVEVGDARRRRLLLALHAQAGVEELALRELRDDEVQAYLERRFGSAELAGELAAALSARTGGHPLFLTHVVDDLALRGIIAEDERGAELARPLEEVEVGVPDGVRSMIAERLARLDDEDRRLLEDASVVGPEFTIDVLAAVGAGASRDEVEERAEVLAQKQGLLRPLELVVAHDGSYTGRYAFSHVLIQSALYDSLPELRRARLHARVAEQIEERSRAPKDELASSLARHFEAGRQPARAIDYLLRAARNATQRFVNDAALQHLDHAAKLLGSLPDDLVADFECRILHDRGLVLRSSGDMQGASEAWRKLADNAREAFDSDTEIRALLLLSSSVFWVDRGECLEVVERARSIAHQARDAVLTAHAQGWCGHWNLTLRGWSDESAEDAKRAVEVCRANENEELLGLHLVRATYMHMLRSDYAAATAASEEGTRLALERGDAFDYMLGHFLRAWAQLHAGQWADLLACLSFGQRIARRNGHVLWDHLFGLIEAQLRAHAFDYERAAELSLRAIEYADEHREAAGQLRFHGEVVRGLAALGQFDNEAAASAIASVEGVIREHPHDVDWMLHLPLRWASSRLHLVRGDLDAAQREAATLHELASSSGERSYLVLASVIQAEVHASRNDVAEARRRLDDARAACDDLETPLAAWRFHICDAGLSEDPAQRKAAHTRARAVLDRLVRELRTAAPGLAKTMSASDDFGTLCVVRA